jgi:hypothetical protein
VRNFGSSLGLAILGSLLIIWNKSNLESGLGAKGVPKGAADTIAECVAHGERACPQAGRALGNALGPKANEAGELVGNVISMSFAEATRDVFYGMAVALVIAFFVALKFMPGGKVEEGEVAEEESVPEAA